MQMSESGDERREVPDAATSESSAGGRGLPEEVPIVPSSPDPAVRVHEISIEEGLAIAMRHHRSGRLIEAEYLYGKVLEAAPGHADALHFQGIVAHQLGRSDVAIERLRSAIEAAPGHGPMHSNLGRILLEVGRIDEAKEAFTRAIELDPASAADAWNNLGTIHKRDGAWERAEAAFREAIRLDGGRAEAHQNLGNLLRHQGRHREAAACYRRALDLKPDAALDYLNLSQALWRAGQVDAARNTVREWLGFQPQNPIALHLASAFGLIPSRERASDDFVARHFDEHAASFDEHLAVLEYRAPALVGTALAEVVGVPQGADGRDVLADVLDAGCGTGLCGPWLAPLSRRLVGVDLSSKMLARAVGRGYDELVVAELTAFLAEHPSSYDAIVSADTLCYFGDLTAVCAATQAALRPGGWFVFTVESLEAIDNLPSEDLSWTLLYHGRYAHHGDSLRRWLAGAGFEDLDLRREILRQEVGSPVHGWIVRARRG